MSSTLDSLVLQPFSATPLLYQRQPRQQDWDRYRKQITTLYKHEGKTLLAVMDIMKREHRFWPTWAFPS